jgi:FkbM family methyltransferase
MPAFDRAATSARRLFYNLDGPWHRRGLAEAAGSLRYSRPALFGMDRRLEELMPWQGGKFLEAGAHDGYTQSNTYFLERHRGWSGVLVEPMPELRAKCERRRPRSQIFGCALVGPEQSDRNVTMHFGDLMSTTGAPEHARGGLEVTGRSGYSLAVPALTISSVLDEAGLGELDVIVLDIEGRELDALRGLGLERHSPRYLLLESLAPEETRAEFDRLLGARFELLEMASMHDLLYRRLEA